LIVGLFYDSIFNTRLSLFESVYVIGILVTEGIFLLVSAYEFWCGEKDIGTFFELFGFVSFLFGPFMLGAVEWRRFIERISESVELPNNYLKPPLLYSFLTELFGFIYTLLIIFVIRKLNVKASLDKT